MNWLINHYEFFLGVAVPLGSKWIVRYAIPTILTLTTTAFMRYCWEKTRPLTSIVWNKIHSGPSTLDRTLLSLAGVITTCTLILLLSGCSTSVFRSDPQNLRGTDDYFHTPGGTFACNRSLTAYRFCLRKHGLHESSTKTRRLTCNIEYVTFNNCRVAVKDSAYIINPFFYYQGGH